MRTELSDDEISMYRDNGFLVIKEFLDQDELQRWREAVEHAVGTRGRERIPGVSFEPTKDQLAEMTDSQRDSATYYQSVFQQRVNLWQTDEGVRGIILDQRLGKVAAVLAGVEGVRVWHDQALIKFPWSNPTAYHLDVPYWSFTSPDAISIWVALDDATLENGCLFYLPGTHKSNKFDNVTIGNEIGAIFKVYPEWREIQPVATPVKAGGAIFHNGLICHGAGANMTTGKRRAMTCAFMPDGSRFNGQRNILTSEYVARMKLGDLLDDENQNPLVWHQE